MSVAVVGVPIGGEDAREKAWRAQVCATAAGSPPSTAVSLTFTLGAARRVDVDNLSRPVMAALCDAGVFRRGFPELARLFGSKVVGPGLRKEGDGH